MAKILHKQQRTGGVRFAKGNQAAVKWTDETVLPLLEKIWGVLTQDDSGLESGNPIRANDIKYVEEAVICAGVDLRVWEYWNEKTFQEKLPESSLVLGTIKKIKKICELRLSYSGQVMDIFHLKNNYDYADKVESKTDITTQGKSINQQIKVQVIDSRDKIIKGD